MHRLPPAASNFPELLARMGLLSRASASQLNAEYPRDLWENTPGLWDPDVGPLATGQQPTGQATGFVVQRAERPTPESMHSVPERASRPSGGWEWQQRAQALGSIARAMTEPMLDLLAEWSRRDLDAGDDLEVGWWASRGLGSAMPRGKMPSKFEVERRLPDVRATHSAEALSRRTVFVRSLDRCAVEFHRHLGDPQPLWGPDCFAVVFETAIHILFGLAETHCAISIELFLRNRGEWPEATLGPTHLEEPWLSQRQGYQRYIADGERMLRNYTYVLLTQLPGDIVSAAEAAGE